MPSLPFIHPQFDPIFFSLGPLHVRWYGIMYLVAFMLFIVLGRYRIKHRPDLRWQQQELDDLLFYGMLGVILGGRLGYVLFYKPAEYLAHPLAIFEVWKGGMAFHGGMLGVLIALWLFGRKTGRHFLQVGDFVAPLVPTGLAAGRLGNFINGELWGRLTSLDAPWAMVFPEAVRSGADTTLIEANPALKDALVPFTDAVTHAASYGLPRHPSQLYQFALEGLTLFTILWLFSRKPRPMGAISGLFLTGYGCFRFIAEFAREPDDFLGLLAGHLSMGQWLSTPMILIGLGMLYWAYHRKTTTPA
jgi:phosphatidylglycerol:prolipoprotein diacylglycerol transferase